MHAHEVEKIVAKLKHAKSMIQSAVDDVVCDGDNKAEIEEWKNEAENAVDEIKSIIEKL